MNKNPNKNEIEKIFDEVDKEIEEAFKTPEGTKKYFDELDDFIESVSVEELSDGLDTMLYNMAKTMLTWSEEKIKTHLSSAPVSIIKEYLKCIRLNKDLQEGNSSKINILKDIVKKYNQKIPHDINQVNLCGWVSRDSTDFYKNEIHYGCKFSIALHWNGRFDTDGNPYVSFIDIEYNGKNAVAISQYLKKGKRVAISGKLIQHRWEQDGVKNSCIKVLANDVVIFNDERNFELTLG